jgi:hypothetical protein
LDRGRFADYIPEAGQRRRFSPHPDDLRGLQDQDFHRHLSGTHFRDYHLLLDEQGEQIFEMTDE